MAAQARSYLTVAAVQPTERAPVLRAPARAAFREGGIASVGAPVAGRVEAVHVRVGDRVSAGAPLVTVRSPEAIAARATLVAARASAESARAELARIERMEAQGVASEREVLEVRHRVLLAESELARARGTLELLGPASRSDRVVVRAPIEGSVIALDATPGQGTTPEGVPLVTVGDPRLLWIEAEVFERDVALVTPGAEVRLELAGTEPMSGDVVSVGTLVRTGARTTTVRIAPRNPPTTLRPGMTGRAEFLSRSPALSIPSTSVIVRNGRELCTYVETAHGDYRFQRRTITVGPSIDGRVVVLSGLRPGERIVTRGSVLLDGAADVLL